MDPIVIVGSGLAGYTLAREFRKLERETPLVILTGDDGVSTPSPCCPMRSPPARLRSSW